MSATKPFFISTKEITTLLNSMKDVNEEITLADLFKNVKYGHRLMHLPPTTDDNFSTINPVYVNTWSPDNLVEGLGSSDYLHEDNSFHYHFNMLTSQINSKFFILERSHEVFEIMVDAHMRQEKRTLQNGDTTTENIFSHLVSCHNIDNNALSNIIIIG